MSPGSIVPPMRFSFRPSCHTNALLNNYLGEMAKIILKYRGTIDEFIGDAILAIFGAPELRSDDAARAVACAVEMQLAMDRVNEFNEREGLPRLEMGVAINSGDVVVGNIGSEERAKYGVVGSPVNLTARIESYSIGGQILASHTTIAKAGEIVQVGGGIEINAKGLKEPMKAYDVRGISGEWNLVLPERKENFVALTVPLSARFAVLEGKHVGEMDCHGQISALSMTGGILSAAEPLEALMNVKMRVVGTTGSEIPDDLYAKVLAVDDRGAVLSFTSIPPDVGNAIKGLLERLPPSGSAK